MSERLRVPASFPSPSVLSVGARLLLALVIGAGMVACDSGGSDDSDPPARDIAGTFQVTVQQIDADYPYADRNRIGVAYAIGGEVGRVITLQRGSTYEFVLGSGVTNHPFYVGETPEGQGATAFSDGVENALATSGSVFFAVPSNAPDSLFYVCDNHVYMGGKMDIEGS